ncbi:hypothetical protein DPMN_112241 [Dreissena polymorpha]|uniref:Uncharacterized protein n=1 Tax=Dreissena polymorpha TaxID=45954 RepID=A0A9D4KGP7_DREPO|nr:hypothetical protein DPMN_112241 [Dreissena polymorpha]
MKFHDIRTDMSKKNIPPLLRRGAYKCDFHSVRSQGLTETIFKLNSCIKETNFLTKFHENWTKNKNASPTGGHVFYSPIPNIVTLRVLTRENCHYIHIKKNEPPTGGHVVSPIWTIFELVRDINKTNVLNNFHDDWTKIVSSRVFTRENCDYIHIEKIAPPTGGHVFSPIWTIFELVRDINKINVLTTFHDDWAKLVTSRVFTRKTAPPTGSHVFQQTVTTFELNLDIIKTNILTNFPLGRHCIGAKLLTKFHEDGTRKQMLTDGRTDGRTTDKDRSEKLT